MRIHVIWPGRRTLYVQKAGREVENMNIWKKVLSVGLSLAMCAGMIVPAFAAVEYDIALGDVDVAQNDDGQTISWSAGHETYKDKASAAVDNEIVVKQSDAETATQNTINVTGAAEGTTVVLSGVNIDVSDTNKAAMSISGEETDVTVELDDENTLKSGGSHAGLELSKGASVTIQDETKETVSGKRVTVTENDGAATLNAISGKNGAGIGTAKDGIFGDIVIESGIINAEAIPENSTDSGAAIGTGWGNNGGGSIKIHGGTVNASADRAIRGIGIGSSASAKIENIEITGGNVTAVGGYYAIGPGEWGKVTGNIKITGGTVTVAGRINGIGPSIGGTIIEGTNDGLTLLVLAGKFDGYAAFSESGSGIKNVLSGQFVWKNSATQKNTSFVIVNTENGEVVREFDMQFNDAKYRSFAVNLPDGDYYILQKTENGKFVKYGAWDSKEISYHVDDGLTSTSGMEIITNKVNWKFKSGTEGREELPPEVTDLLKAGIETTFDDVTDDGGKWIFQGWTIGKPIEDGKLQDVDAVGTWVYAANPPAPEPPRTPTGPSVFDGYDFGGTTTIENEAVPLAAGPVTRAEFLDYLWRHEGQPANDGVCTFTDVEDDHEYILALAWAEQAGIAEAYDDGTFLPDELVTVAAVREFLSNFAEVFGLEVDVDTLATLTGEDDEAVLNCDEVIAEFFGEEISSEEEAA